MFKMLNWYGWVSIAAVLITCVFIVWDASGDSQPTPNEVRRDAELHLSILEGSPGEVNCNHVINSGEAEGYYLYECEVVNDISGDVEQVEYSHAIFGLPEGEVVSRCVKTSDYLPIYDEKRCYP